MFIFVAEGRIKLLATLPILSAKEHRINTLKHFAYENVIAYSLHRYLSPDCFPPAGTI
jgi:hypothetical protein